VQGQGDSTVITLDETGKTYANGVIAVWGAATFKNMKIIGASTAPVTAFQICSYNNPTTGINFTGDFRLTNITYEGHSDGYFALITSGVDSGLIDHCRIGSSVGYAELIFARGPSNAWQSNNTLGGSNNIFIENNTFQTGGYVCDANANARVVVRYNIITGPQKIDGHGLASNSPARSFRHMEIYGNNWTATGGGTWADIEFRGGTGMIFDNTSNVGWAFLHEYAYDSEPKPWYNLGFSGSSVTHGTVTTITTPTPHGFKTGWPVWCEAPLGVVYGFYNVTVTSPTTFTIPRVTTADEVANGVMTYKTPYDYPIKDQVGSGKDGSAREPAYVFNNKQGGAAWARSLGTVCVDAITLYRAQTENTSATFTERDVIQSNRDFFADAGFDTSTGIQRGTKAAMLAYTPNVTGFGWWVTDEGSWDTTKAANTSGQLYTWNGSAWVLKYTPYTYPHPLSIESGPKNTTAKFLKP